MNFSDAAIVEAALPNLRNMSRSVDCFTEVENALGRAAGETRRKVINAVECDFGTLGGPQVEPPQHWERDRWFLPVARRRSGHLKAMAEDGGRSCEFFFHIDANPGDELTLWVTGYALQTPANDCKNICAVLSRVFIIQKTALQRKRYAISLQGLKPRITSVCPI